jgi:hypothetical protein
MGLFVGHYTAEEDHLVGYTMVDRIHIDNDFPLMYRSDKGFWYRCPDNNFYSDYGSVPQVLQWVVADRMCPKAYLFHDQSYLHHGLLKSVDAKTFEFVSFSRAEADALLYEAAQVYPINPIKIEFMYTGVRVGGWFPWCSYARRKALSRVEV